MSTSSTPPLHHIELNSTRLAAVLPHTITWSVDEIDPNDKSAPGNILRGMPSSDLYDEHMQVRTFDERLDVKADIRNINEAIEGMKQSYRIVDRLGEGWSASNGPGLLSSPS